MLPLQCGGGCATLQSPGAHLRSMAADSRCRASSLSRLPTKSFSAASRALRACCQLRGAPESTRKCNMRCLPECLPQQRLLSAEACAAAGLALQLPSPTAGLAVQQHWVWQQSSKHAAACTVACLSPAQVGPSPLAPRRAQTCRPRCWTPRASSASSCALPLWKDTRTTAYAQYLNRRLSLSMGACIPVHAMVRQDWGRPGAALAGPVTSAAFVLPPALSCLRQGVVLGPGVVRERGSPPGQVGALPALALEGALPVADVGVQLALALLQVSSALLGVVQRLP